MKTATFYNSSLYKERQSIIAKTNWQKGIYDALRTQKQKQCIRPECEQIFKAKPSSKKKFCSCSCAAKFNNLQRSKINIGMKETIEKLYQNGCSMMEISDKTGWAYGRVVWCMKKFSIPRRSVSEAVYRRLNPEGDPFRIKKNLTPKDEKLLGLGLGLYWGEGNKASKTAVRLGNSDPKLISVFREFLIKICGIKQKKLKYNMLLFNDANEKEAINFWAKELGIQTEQIGSVTSLKPRGKGTYKKRV